MTSARWRTSTSPAGNRPAAGDRWSGTAGAAAVPSGPVFQQPVCVLRTAAGPDQGAAAGGRRIRAAVQTGGRGRVPVATGPAGDAKIQLERNCLNVRSTSIGIEGKCKRGLFGTISLTLGNSRLQSLDPGRASERPRASGPPAVFPWAAPNNLPHQHGESPGTAQCQGRERQIWHARYYSFSFLFRPQQPHVLMSNPCGAAQQAAAPYHFAIN